MPRRLKREGGRHALVDGIPFALPVRSFRMQALMAAFPVDTEQARALLPPSVVPVRLWNKTLLVITVVNYQETSIGRYIEYSVALSCARRDEQPPRLVPLLLPGPFRFGQYVLDLPVSSEVSVKGGKGIWGMPKHQANLDFVVTDDTVSSQYDKDGELGVLVEMERPRGPRDAYEVRHLLPRPRLGRARAAGARSAPDRRPAPACGGESTRHRAARG